MKKRLPDSTEPIYLAGPTGCGKSSVALALAEKIGSGEIVNADAFQLYRGLEILTAAPPQSDRDRVPHYLYGVLDLSESCDAARFSRLAEEKVTGLKAAGKIPIVVGGSGLYLKSLTHGLGPTPPGDAKLRVRLDAMSLEELVAELEKIDPVGAAETNLKNRRYVTRNLEISILTGVPASTLKRDFERSSPEFDGIYLTRERDDLYKRINRRTQAMFSEGLIEQVAELAGAEISPTAEKAIGLREIRSLLAGEISEAECIELIQQATRRYSKRQRTWFRREKQFQTICLAPDETPESVADRICINLFS
ncbi:MAG: tRNA (adenosine(37)-N6)-dimethylallyltransferase MiaA [Verrucomicrobiales bacterium]|nr:tRNA (adenosine(37)-N6)-dimethylallyltransferase MiaA [Verrucomicrobiales bacterium]